MKKKCIKVLVSGHVQGVFFRDSTRRQAVRLGLSGHAINLVDGCVEVLACGEPDALKKLQVWLKVGPPLAEVEALQIEAFEGPVPEWFTIG